MNNPSTTKAPLADYLAHLPLAEEERERLGESASFSELHACLAGAEGAAADAGGDPALASVRARLQLGTPELDDAEMFGVDAQGRTFLKISPPIRRTKVIPEPWRTNILVRGWRRLTGRSNPPKPKRALPRARWQRVGSLRRFILLLLMLAQTSVATYYMKGILPYQGWAFVDLEELAQQSLLDTVQQVLPYVIQFGILALFAILFCWVSAGFWTALMGFWELLTGRDRYRISGSSAGSEPIAADARTAIVMPICNEDVPRVFAGLRATVESMAATGEMERFWTPCMRACSSSPPASTARCSPPACTSGNSASRTTGATTRSSACSPSSTTAPWRRCRARARSPARSCPTTSSRLR